MSLMLTLSQHAEAHLRELAKQQGVSTEQYVAQLVEAFADRQALTEASEKQLLGRLSLGFSKNEWQRYYQLIHLRQEENLTEAQHHELVTLYDRLEHANNQRLATLIGLSKRRDVPLEQLMNELGITKPDVL